MTINLFEQRVNLKINDDSCRVGKALRAFSIAARLLVILDSQVQFGAFIPSGGNGGLTNTIDGTDIQLVQVDGGTAGLVVKLQNLDLTGGKVSPAGPARGGALVDAGATSTVLRWRNSSAWTMTA